MKTSGRIALTLSGLLVLAGGIAFANRDAIMMRVFERALDKAMARDVMATLDPKALHVGFCGTGSPLPSRDRASACTVVVAGGKQGPASEPLAPAAPVTHVRRQARIGCSTHRRRRSHCCCCCC